jgi:hypothetical protein
MPSPGNKTILDCKMFARELGERNSANGGTEV